MPHLQQGIPPGKLCLLNIRLHSSTMKELLILFLQSCNLASLHSYFILYFILFFLKPSVAQQGTDKTRSEPYGSLCSEKIL